MEAAHKPSRRALANAVESVRDSVGFGMRVLSRRAIAGAWKKEHG
jgi:hypothetical protein